MSDLKNFPVVREATPTEVEYIEDVYRKENRAGTFFCFFFCSVYVPVFCNTFLVLWRIPYFFLPLSMLAISVFLAAAWYRKWKDSTYRGEPIREVRGTVTAKQSGILPKPYLHGRVLDVPDQWRDELMNLQQPVHALIYPMSENAWITVEINGWLSIERDIEDEIISKHTFLREPGLNPLYWFRSRDYARRYHRLRRKEQHEGLEDAYTESPLDKG